MGAGLISKMDGKIKICIMTLENEFIKKFGINFKKNVNLSNYSWFNLGGDAEFFYKAEDKYQLIEFLKESKKKI